MVGIAAEVAVASSLEDDLYEWTDVSAKIKKIKKTQRQNDYLYLAKIIW